MSSDQSSSLIFLVIIVAAFWFLVIRPARKRTAQAAQLQRSIELGDRVMLTSGIYGYITGLGTETLLLEVSDGVEVTAHRQAVAKVLPEESEEEYEYADELADDDEAESGAEPGADPGDEQPSLDATPDEEQPQPADGRTDDDRR